MLTGLETSFIFSCCFFYFFPFTTIPNWSIRSDCACILVVCSINKQVQKKIHPRSSHAIWCANRGPPGQYNILFFDFRIVCLVFYSLFLRFHQFLLVLSCIYCSDTNVEFFYEHPEEPGGPEYTLALRCTERQGECLTFPNAEGHYPCWF